MTPQQVKILCISIFVVSVSIFILTAIAQVIFMCLESEPKEEKLSQDCIRRMTKEGK